MSQINDLLQTFISLHIPKGKYVFFGSGPLAIRGLRETAGLDVLVTADIFEEFKKKSDWVLKLGGDRAQILQNNNIEIMNNWWPGDWDVQKLIAEAEEIEGISFVKLEHVLRWKKLRNKPKDQLDIEILQRLVRN